MVIAPPMADLRYLPIRWQTVFVSTRPLIGKSAQNDECCGICATVRLQLSQTPPIRRVILATARFEIVITGKGSSFIGNAPTHQGVAARRFRDRPRFGRIPGSFNVR
jgi:hypothetical protein